MRRLAGLTLVAFLLGLPVFAGAEVLHRSEWSSVDLNRPLPADLVHPEGTTRWELAAVSRGAGWTRSISTLADGTLAVDESSRNDSESRVFSTAARGWWLPQLEATRPPLLTFTETLGSGLERVTVQRQSIGTGWIFLPSGPREVTLYRSLVQRSEGGDTSSATRLFYRWVDSRNGPVAEAWGTPTSDGRAIAQLEGAAVIEAVTQGGVGLKIYSSEISATPFGRLALGFDRRGTCTTGGNPCVADGDCLGGSDLCTIPISQVTTPSHATMGDLIAAAAWDFTPTQLADSRYEIGSTTVPINPAETCNSGACGFATSTQMGREDKNFVDPGNVFITLSATEDELRGSDYTIWLRAGVRHEGNSTGGLGQSESRFCYEGIDTNGDTRPEVPLWRFSNFDAGAGEYFMQQGDSWTHTPFNCEQSIFNHVCPSSCGFGCEIWIRGCSGAPNQGTQSSVVLGEGPVTLPSGHTMNALLVKQVVDFCVYIGNSCALFDVDRVHQAIYLWVVPNIGTVARLMSEQNESNDTAFDDLQETDLKYGLFPPRTISETATADDSISISWDPGTITHHISGYKVYWGTATGATTPYPFDSDTNAGQISIIGTTATISGLTASTDHYITVTALSDYTDVSTSVVTTYESLLFPTATSGAVGPLPAELVSTTTGGACTPTQELLGLTVDKAALGGPIEACWLPSADLCVDGYTLLGANAATAAGGFSTVVADTGLVNCHTFNPTESYFLVVGKGSGGSGPWGHYGM